MMNEFLKIYNEELASLQLEAKNFASHHPLIADQLGIKPESINDPLVRHLTQTFAFLTAKMRLYHYQTSKKWESKLIRALFPHIEHPLPSCCIVQFKLRKNTNKAVRLNPDTSFVIKNNENKYIQFRNVKGIELNDIEIKSIEYKNHLQGSELKIRLYTNNVIENNKAIEFYIADHLPIAFQIHELIFENLDKLYVLKNDNEKKELKLPDYNIRHDHNVSPLPNYTSKIQQLSREFFNYPEKFLFFSIEISEEIEKDFSLLFSFSRPNSEVEEFINNNSILLNCSLLVNLYPHCAEPIRFETDRNQYPIILDHNPDNIKDLYRIEKIYALDHKNKEIELKPFFEEKFFNSENYHSAKWSHERSCKSNEHHLLNFHGEITNDISTLNTEILACDKLNSKKYFTQQSEIFLKDITLNQIDNIKICKPPSDYQTLIFLNDFQAPLLNQIKINQFINSNEIKKALMTMLESHNNRENNFIEKLINNIESIDAAYNENVSIKKLNIEIELSLKDKKFRGYSLLKLFIRELLQENFSFLEKNK